MDNCEVCVCMNVSLKEIKEAIENGAKTVEDIKDITDAGIACKMCINEEEDPHNDRTPHIEDILKEYSS